VHELAVHWYRGLWREVYHEVPRVPNDSTRRIGSTSSRPRADDIPHQGSYGPNTWVDDGLRLTRSVIRASRAGRSIHPTEKPAAILAPLIEYSVPVGGLVLDPFAGSCSTLLTARSLGRRAIGIDADESMCETAAERLSIPDLFGGAA
jgi:site-specific DNA-methyltransferase (adenine-specific)